MPLKLHRWYWDPDTSPDPGWPRRYLTYDFHTPCAACHEPNGLRRISQHLFGGPATRCRHHRGRYDRRHSLSNGGWGGCIRGLVRHKSCRIPDHYALAFYRGTDTSAMPDRLGGTRWGYRTRLPEPCYERTPRRLMPSHTQQCPCHYCYHCYHQYYYDNGGGNGNNDGSRGVVGDGNGG